MDSDEEFEYESDDGGYGEDDNADEEAIHIENMFYEADDNKANRPLEALKQYEQVVEMEKARGSEVVWRFKALQNIVILCARLGRFDEMARQYENLLSYMDQVTRNDASDAINTVLDSVSSAPTGTGGGAGVDSDTLSKLEVVYSLTLSALQKTQNQRLWFNTSVKLAKLYLEQGDVARLASKLRLLHESCLTLDGKDDVAAKGSQLLEVYALEIQLCALTKNSLRMKEVYPRTLNLTSAIADPRNVAVIRESGGKMYMSEKKWQLAYNEFFEAFKNYQETGNASRAKVMLKYVVLANMLALSDINPFDSREAKVYQEDPEIAAMHQLRLAFDNNEIHAMDNLLRDPKYKILSDPFMKYYLDDLLRGIRLQVLQSIVQPYRTARLDFLATELKVSKEELTSLLVQLILDDKIAAAIDDVNGNLEVYSQAGQAQQRYAHASRWVGSLNKINAGIMTKLCNAQA